MHDSLIIFLGNNNQDCLSFIRSLSKPHEENEMNYRIEKNSMGEIKVSSDKYYGAQIAISNLSL
jgi:hypothetical protein